MENHIQNKEVIFARVQMLAGNDTEEDEKQYESAAFINTNVVLD